MAGSAGRSKPFPATHRDAIARRRMFNLLGVTLLQPESVVSARVPGGAPALASLIEDLRSELSELYEAHTESGSRSLCLACGPGERFELWLGSEDGQASAEERDRVTSLTQRVRPPVVVAGPIALALVYAVGAEAPAEAQLNMPEEWRAIVQASDSPLDVEQIVTRIWSLTS